MGATIALPFLDAMYPAFASQAVKKSLAPNRMAFLYVPNGIIMEDWTPARRRSASTPLGESASHLARAGAVSQRHHDADGLDLRWRPRAWRRRRRPRARGRGLPDRRASRKTYGKDIKAGISMDQIAARHFEGQTTFASLELGCEEGIQGGNCDNGTAAPTATASRGGPRTRRIRRRSGRAPCSSGCSASADDEKDPARRQRHGHAIERASSISRWTKRRASRRRSAAPTAASSTNTCTPFATSRSAFSSAEHSNIDARARRRAVGERPRRFRRALAAHVRPAWRSRFRPT